MKESNTANPLVAVVVPVFNNKEDTREFLESFKKVTYPNHEIIIIDDGSSDGTEEMLESEYPEVRIVKGDGTLMSALAFNLGIEKAREIEAEYILQIDNDTTVEPEFLSILVDTALRNPRSIITSKVYYYYDPQRLIDAGVEFSWWKGGYSSAGYDEIDLGQYEQERDVEFGVMGILIKTSFFDDFGLVDHETFPHWRWEGDLYLRARKKGYRFIYQPKSRVWHKVSSTAKKTGLYSKRRFIKNPVGTLIYAFSSDGQGGPLGIRTLLRYYGRHYPLWFIPYGLFCDFIKRIMNELKGKR